MLIGFNYLFIFGDKSELYKKYTQKYHSLLIPTNLFSSPHSFLHRSSPPLQGTSLVSGLPSFVSFVPWEGPGAFPVPSPFSPEGEHTLDTPLHLAFFTPWCILELAP